MPITLGPVSGHRASQNNNIVLHNNFSSTSAAKKVKRVDPKNEDGFFQRSSPSALEKAKLEVITPGHSVFVLQKYAANGGALIRQSDFVTLCESARPGKNKDAKVIAVALKEFKKNNRFVLQLSGCRAAVEGMLRAMTPTWKVQDGKPRVRSAVFVAEQILDEKTGMYFAVETLLVDKVLEQLQQGLLEMEENDLNLKVENKGEGADAAEDAEAEEEPSADEKMLRDALRVTGELVRFLIKRKSRPHLDMKKRARRVYLKKLQISGGPYASTMQLAAHISILMGGSAVVQGSIITPWEEAWWTKHKHVDPAVLKMIEVASEMELEQQRSAEAAEAIEEAETGNGEVDQVEEELHTDAESEEEKED